MAPRVEESSSGSNATTIYNTRGITEIKKEEPSLIEKPPAITPDRTFIYKTAPSKILSGTNTTIPPIPIKADLYVPSSSSANLKLPILLFIHGGGWIHSNRLDYGRTWFKRFLTLNYVICSMDYRLLPESEFWKDQCEDVRDIERWLREKLEGHLIQEGFDIRLDTEKIIVAGASAGAHLALLTPKLWTHTPLAILSLYGPTNFHSIPYLNKGRWRRENYSIPECTPSLLAQATTYAKPPTDFPVPKTDEDRRQARHFMGQHIYRNEALARFLLRGLIREKSIVKVEGKEELREELRLPEERDVVREDEVDEISALSLCKKITYPPMYQLMGTNDWLFQISQMTDFGDELTRQGIKNRAIIVDGGEHGFDIRCVFGDEVDVKYVKPAVEWLHKLVR